MLTFGNGNSLGKQKYWEVRRPLGSYNRGIEYGNGNKAHGNYIIRNRQSVRSRVKSMVCFLLGRIDVPNNNVDTRPLEPHEEVGPLQNTYTTFHLNQELSPELHA